jgi:signal transduction histidine kinase
VRLRSLRTKLILANVLPVLLLMPLLSVYLLNTLDELYTLKLLQWLNQEGVLIADQVREDPVLLEDTATAQRFLNRIAQSTDARVLLLSHEGRIVGSSRTTDTSLIGAEFAVPAVKEALGGTQSHGVGRGLTSEVVYVAIPIQHDGTVAGVLRLSYEVGDVRSQVDLLHWFVVGGTSVTALLAVALGLAFSRTLTNPIQRLVTCIQEIAGGNNQARIETQREDEIGILAESFNQMAAKLASAESVRRQQLAAITHELARPLTSMSAAVEVLLDDRDADRDLQRELLVGVWDEMARLERLVNTLRQEQKRVLQPLQLQCSAVSLPHLLRATAAKHKASADRCGVALHVEAPTSLPLVYADEDRLIQVLTNLFDNALKYTLRGGHIFVKAEQCDVTSASPMVQVSVADTGVGIASDELPHIFQQFYRGGSQWPEKTGIGLGLTICRQIVTAHGGKIWAEGEPGRGAHIIFTLRALREL